MFDVGFVELMLVSVVVILVVKPSEIPSTIRSIMLQVGKMKNTLVGAQELIIKEAGLHGIEEQLKRESIRMAMEKLSDESNAEFNITKTSSDEDVKVSDQYRPSSFPLTNH